jgi:DNA-binding NtrC family response regulator
VNEGFDVTTAFGTEAAISSLQSGGHDLVLVDDHFADLTSSCFLKQLVRIPVKVPAIVYGKCSLSALSCSAVQPPSDREQVASLRNSGGTE